MTGFNPWIDVAVLIAFALTFGGVCYLGDKFSKKAPALRGATRL